MSDPIGHLPDETNEQAMRDAAAGPPVGGTPRSSHPWPDPPRPSTQRRARPGQQHFCCATCTHRTDSIADLISHTIQQHRRGPYDTERIPL